MYIGQLFRLFCYILSVAQWQMLFPTIEVVNSEANNHPDDTNPTAVGLTNQYYEPYYGGCRQAQDAAYRKLILLNPQIPAEFKGTGQFRFSYSQADDRGVGEDEGQ